VQKELGAVRRPVCPVSPDKARFIRFAKAGEISAKVAFFRASKVKEPRGNNAKGLKTGILGGGNEHAKVGQGQGK
jgi:hypothetical protein